MAAPATGLGYAPGRVAAVRQETTRAHSRSCPPPATARRGRRRAAARLARVGSPARRPSRRRHVAPRRLLERQVEAAGLDRVLVPREAFRPYPPASDRAAWDRLVSEDRRRVFVAAAEKQLEAPWEVLPATRFLDFVRDGNRSRYEKLLFSRRQKLGLLVLGETLEGRGRFTDAIADGVWLLCEESFWGVPAHVGVQKRGAGLPDVTEPTVDLFAAETGALLAWTDYLVGDRLDAVHPLVRERLRLEVDRRILTPALERDDFWWMGFTPREVNNWNPWINSNWLAAALLLERDPARRTRAVAKIARSLDRFVDAYPDDGGCDEGPSYWGRAGASLFEALELAPRGHGREGGRLPRAGRARDRPVHRERPRGGRLVREHRRRLGPRRPRAGARLPLRPGDRRRDPRGLRRVARGAARAVRARRRAGTSAASPGPCRRCSRPGTSRKRRPRSRCPPRCG